MSHRRSTQPAVTDQDYARLLAVRTAWRRFERWSAEQAAAHGLTSSQHQLLLVIRGNQPTGGPTIGQAAEALLIRHHSAVELVDRCQRAGLVARAPDPDDHRVVRLRLTDTGTAILRELSGAHLEELSRLAPLFESMRATLEQD